MIQYQFQQLKIVPAITAAWAHLITNTTMRGMYDAYISELSRKSKRAFELLQDIHCMAAGLKAMGSWHGEYFGEILKQSCGGHGFLQISGLTKPHLDFGVGFVTAEGDNHVLT